VRIMIRALAVVAVLGAAFFATTLTASVASADDPEQNAVNVASVEQEAVAVGGEAENNSLIVQRNSQYIGGGYGGARQNAANLAFVDQDAFALFGDAENNSLIFQRNRQFIGW
jgi:hypothetical protein